MCPATFPSDGKPFPVQLGKPVHGHSTAVIHRERLMENASERNQLFHRNPGRYPTLHKSYVNSIRRIVQLLEVIHRPFRWQDLDFHAVSGQKFLVLIASSQEDATGRAAEDRDRVGWCGSD